MLVFCQRIVVIFVDKGRALHLRVVALNLSQLVIGDGRGEAGNLWFSDACGSEVDDGVLVNFVHFFGVGRELFDLACIDVEEDVRWIRRLNLRDDHVLSHFIYLVAHVVGLV